MRAPYIARMSIGSCTSSYRSPAAAPMASSAARPAGRHTSSMHVSYASPPVRSCSWQRRQQATAASEKARCALPELAQYRYLVVCAASITSALPGCSLSLASDAAVSEVTYEAMSLRYSDQYPHLWPHTPNPPASCTTLGCSLIRRLSDAPPPNDPLTKNAGRHRSPSLGSFQHGLANDWLYSPAACDMSSGSTTAAARRSLGSSLSRIVPKRPPCVARRSG
mmetsp:Transcript_11043/g.32858  ORF Transcript_11043/g.32858 Transcript_11043/m.32858 type:complete len:222 (-) Transcript_11043:91-756(-)